MSDVPKLTPTNTVFFVCDIQTRFANVIYQYDQVVSTASKLVKLAKILNCEVVVTEQNPTALGHTAPEIDLESLGPLHLGTVPKTLFSMWTPETEKLLSTKPKADSIVLFGIETHICVLQTALDLLSHKFAVHVVADGVSSCNKQEIPIALERIRQAGGNIVTSESLAFQLMRDAANPEFKTFSKLIKAEKESTSKALIALL